MSDVAGLAARFAALGHEARLEIVRRLLAAHPGGHVVGELQEALGIPGSTLTHHLDALHHEGLVTKNREGRFLRYRAASQSLGELLDFLYAECCQGSSAVPPPGPLVTIRLPSAARPDAGTKKTAEPGAGLGRSGSADHDDEPLESDWRAW